MDIWGSYPRSWRVIWQQVFHILFIRVKFDFLSTSGQVRAIPQHENSSRNSILTTRTFKNWLKLRNYEKHDLSDEIASPGSWGTLKLKISLLTQQILWVATPGEISVTRRAYIFRIAMLEEKYQNTGQLVGIADGKGQVCEKSTLIWIMRKR